MRFVAFVRGINVGGKTVRMAGLRKMFESLGFRGVSTYKASGNVIFDSGGSAASLTKKIESALQRLIGSETHAVVRPLDDLRGMAEGMPFKGIKVTPDTRLYVTFLPKKPVSKMKRYESPDGAFRILRVTGSELYSVLVLSPKAGTVDLMAMIEKEFGKGVTTRNWNTITGIVEAG